MGRTVTEFTPYSALLGGFLIGLSAVLLMLFNGRIAGMTGILSGVLPPLSGDWQWRAAFIAGAIAGPIAYGLVSGNELALGQPVPLAMQVIGGVIVGVGVTYSSGCTSGHGVCGMARFSRRSFAATCVFMAATVATVFIIRHVIGA